MRYLYPAVLAGLLPQLAAAQASEPAPADTTRPLVADERWVRSRVDSAGECTEVMHWSGRGGLVRVYHPSGRLKQYVPYADLATGTLHGVATNWYDSGQLAIRQAFLRGRRDGELLLYYPNGQLKRQTQYSAGNELLGTCFDTAGAPLAYFPYEQPPLYPGGQPQLISELMLAIRRWRPPSGPVRLSKAQIHVSFQINERGSVVNPQVALSDEHFAAVAVPGGRVSYSNWQAAMEQAVTPLVSKVQQAILQLTKPFYPGQRDGATVSWQYSFIIPFDYNAWPPPAGNIRRRGTNFGL